MLSTMVKDLEQNSINRDVIEKSLTGYLTDGNQSFVDKGLTVDSPQITGDKTDYEAGAKEFEFFWLRPKKMAGHEAVLRMKINKKWSGWKLKDELIDSIGLTIGDTINTEVTVLNAPGLIRSADDTDLFADGINADWLLENDIGVGSIIEGKVRFMYSKAPVGGLESKEVWKISLVLLEGYKVLQGRENSRVASNNDQSSILKELMKLMSQ